MKTQRLYSILLLSALILLSLFLYNFITPETKTTQNPLNELIRQPSPGGSDRFLFGAMDSWMDHGDNYNHYEQIGLNLWHNYLEDDYDNNGRKIPRTDLDPNDRLYNDVSTYSAGVLDKMREASSHNNTKLLWHRPKIEWLCYAQSSIYEAEPISPGDPQWFYSFNYQDIGVPEPDNGKMAMHCRTGIIFTDPPGIRSKKAEG